VIPRGSNALVSHIQRNTRIPVLGHADGVCHVYLDRAADVEMAERLLLDAKLDYPAACNAAEAVLVHETLVGNGMWAKIANGLQEAGVLLFGGPRGVAELGLPEAPALHHEYGNASITIEGKARHICSLPK
jgi:delta-1-pyrroline-5-carboxylate synthetase